jgi:type II secretory pathway pseudopilin PulG
MMNFKRHSSGFAYLEIMFALILLGIFGSSLFMSQSFLLQKIMKSHVSMQAALQTNTLMLEYASKVKQAELGQQPITIPAISKKYDNPEMEIAVSGSYVTLPTGQQGEKKSSSSTSNTQEKPCLFQIKAVASHEFGRLQMNLLLYKPQAEKATA